MIELRKISGNSVIIKCFNTERNTLFVLSKIVIFFFLFLLFPNLLFGQNYPSSGSNISLSGSSASWTNSGNIYSNNTSYSSVSITNGNYSNYLYASGFGFSIPSNSVINSITITVERSSNGNWGDMIRDNDVRLVKNGSVIGNNYAQSPQTYWINNGSGGNPTNTETVSYTGGGSALWGTTWSADEINNSGFGVAISALSNYSTATAFIDYISVTVSYTTVGGSTTITTGTTSYNVPAGVTCIKVECWGGGGRGGSRNPGFRGAGGGGGGGAYSSSFINVTSGTGYPVSVGVGSSSTSPGGDTYFNDASTVMAKGGNSVSVNAINGVSGGAASSGVGTIKFNGGDGANGVDDWFNYYGGGGGSSSGTGAVGSNGNTSNGGNAPSGGGNGGNGATSNGNGFAGSAPGGGGGGARGNNVTGGNGANGQIVISYAVNLSNLSTSATSPCQGSSSTVTLSSSSLSSGTYSVNYTLSGANSGTVTTSVTFSGGSGNFTTAALANSGSTTVTINYFTLPGWCNSTPVSGNTASFTVNTSPNTPGAISGNNAVCPSSFGNGYSITAVPGATTYTWSVPSGWTINSGQGTTSISVNAGTSGGTISVTAGNSCATSAASNLNVSIADMYASISVTSPSSPCSTDGSATVIASGGSGSYSYSWSTGSTNSTITGLNIGNYNVTVNDNSCSVSRTYYTTLTTSYGADCGIPGKDGDGSIASAPNTYFIGTGSSATLRPGASQIELSGSLGSLSEGDILMIIQMQGADINTTNTSSYGNASNVTAGNYEYVVVQNVVSPFVVLKTSTPVQGTYVNQDATSTLTRKRYQVLKVPQYDDLTILNNITVPSWDGSTGGIVAIDVAGTLNMNGNTISANGAGFRGGAGVISGTAGGTPNFINDYVFPSGTNGQGFKGEGIAGSPASVYNGSSVINTGTSYPTGDKGKGSPGNAGGGGNDANAGNSQNSGGGGGANIASGGKGGNTWNSNLDNGGRGGKAFGGSATKVIMGGGGGAGTSNNTSVPHGGTGGGIVVIHAGTIASAGTITANGTNAPNAGSDGAGGGGAGGSIIISADAGISNITASVTGGRGGDAWPTQAPGGYPGERHGPGGGGGGGVIYSTGNLASTTVSSGVNGITTTANDAYGSETPSSPGSFYNVGGGSFSTTIFGRNCPAPDDTNPTINCPSNLTGCSGSTPAAYSSYAEFVSAGGSASDGGSGLATTCFNLYSEVAGDPITRTYRIYDNAGNYSDCQQTIAIQNISSSVTLISDDNECPQLLESQGFEPDNNGPYDEGTTEVIFTVSRNNSTTGTWGFSFNISGGTAESVTPAQSSGTAGNGAYSELSGTSVELHFYITNVANNPLTVTLTVTSISDSNLCSSNDPVSEHAHILAMPAVGSFN